MLLEIGKINRQVHFLTAPPFDEEDKTGANNKWLYNRAPEGYKFLLYSLEVSTSKQINENIGIYSMYDGHEYTHWNIYPGVESRELLARGELSHYEITNTHPLNGWECKEYTIGIRSAEPTGVHAFRIVMIVWYYLEKMSIFERLMYACLHPRTRRLRKALGPTTVEGEERG